MATVNEKMTAIADAIRDKTGGTDELSLDGMAQAIPLVYDKGYVTGYSTGFSESAQCIYYDFYDIFWDSYQDNGNRAGYTSAFEGAFWTQDSFKPKYPLSPSLANSMFKFSNITDLTTVDLNFKTNLCGGFYAMCREATKLVSVGDVYTVGAANIGEIFYGCTSLVNAGVITVHGTMTYTNSFYNCKSLTDITFAGTIGQNLDIRYSPLNKASIESIIGCLSATATAKTLTLKKSAVNTAFGIDVDDKTTYPEGSEFYTLRHSKDNWTFSYM